MRSARSSNRPGAVSEAPLPWDQAPPRAHTPRKQTPP